MNAAEPATPGAPDPALPALLCLLRLQHLALAAPQPEAGVRAMAAELAAVPGIARVAVAVPDGDGAGVRWFAHAGALEPPVDARDPAAVEALATGRMVQRAGARPEAAVVHAPIIALAPPLGVLGLTLRAPVPLPPWCEELVWATADLMALLLLDHGAPRPRRGRDSAILAARPSRQRDVLVELASTGATNAEIGGRLGLRARTVKVHLLATFRQLGVRRRADAIRCLLTEHADWLTHERAARGGGPLLS